MGGGVHGECGGLSQQNNEWINGCMNVWNVKAAGNEERRNQKGGGGSGKWKWKELLKRGAAK